MTDPYESFNIDEIHHLPKVPYLDEINHNVEITRMNEMHCLADEIHHLWFRPLIRSIITVKFLTQTQLMKSIIVINFINFI